MNSKTESVNMLNIDFSDGRIRREECYPYLAYINGEGNPCGSMFQSFLLDLSKGDTLACWESDLASVFASEGGIGELDSAAEDVKNLLGLDKDSTFGVYVKAPLPEISLKLFGDINGDGIAEKLLDVEDCLKAISLFATDFIRHFVIGNYKNLDFKGFVLESCGDDRALKPCADFLSEKGITVFTHELDTIEITEKTDFSSILAADGGMRIIRTEDSRFILSCAFSKNGGLRDIYDSLFILLNPEKLLNDSEETPEEMLEEIPEETCDKSVQEADIEEPVAEKESEIQVCLKDESISLDLPLEETTVSSEDGEKGEETALKEEKDTEKSKKCVLCQEIKLTKKQKNVLIGAGVAAATLGLAYLVGKFTKD